jgi:hypothetical protein
VDPDDTVQLAQDVTRLHGGAASTEARDRAFVDNVGLLDVDLLEDTDAHLAGALLLQPEVEVRDLRDALLALGLEVADTRGVEDQVLDVLVLGEDRTDPLRR